MREPIKILIEVAGGVVSGVFCDLPDEIEVVLVDWDSVDAGENGVNPYPVDSRSEYLQSNPDVARQIEELDDA